MKTKFQSIFEIIAEVVIKIPVLIFLLLLGLSFKIESIFVYSKNDTPENQENSHVISYNELATLEDFDQL